MSNLPKVNPVDKLTHNEIVSHYYYDVMGFCGCYTPGEVLNQLEEGLSKFDRDGKEWENNTEWVDKNLILAYLMDKLELTEHGGSIGGAWLTDKGKKLLEALKKSDDNWEDESGWDSEDYPANYNKFIKEWK